MSGQAISGQAMQAGAESSAIEGGERGTEEAVARFARLFPPAERTLPAILQHQAARFPERPLFTSGATRWTYRDAAAIAAGMARCLRDAGIAPGDRVALLLGNGPEFIQSYLGCAWAGIIAVPINTASRGAQLQHILGNCGARLALVDARFLPSLQTIECAALPLREVWAVADDQPLSAMAPPETDYALKPFPAPGAPGAPAAPHPAKPGDTVAILYTSGTTGLSKGVCCPQAQYFWWGAYTGASLGLGDGEVLVTTLPLFHTNALNAFYQALLTGSELVAEPRFSVSGFTDTLIHRGATVTYLLGAMAPMLLSRPPSDGDRAHHVRIALAPGVPAEYQPVFTRRFGMGLVDGYGSTETNCVIGDPLADQRPGTMGRIRPGFAARVVDEDDNPLETGEAGELVLRADEPFAFATGYFAMPDKTVEAWRNLWFHTGDRVVQEEDGRFRFLDRMKDAIRRRGENISSFEVEQVVVSHPAVSNAAAFPVRSDLAEDEVMVAVVLHPGQALRPEELLDHCQPKMPYFAVPRYVEFVDALPATENGKVQKFKLRERGIGDRTWDRERVGYRVRR